ncbi:MAG: cation-translocating P-type ATPase [Anaerolineaceae bacterium]|nr:cation-translocating P-type ATPase [Anaerolineaceae bacterium]
MAVNKVIVNSDSKQDVSFSWHAISGDETLQKLATELEKGLSIEEAEKRLLEYGPNQLEEGKRTTFFQMVFRQLNNFVVILLIVASIISAFLGEYVDASAIIAIVVLNTIMGVVQENRAEQALATLKKLAAPDAQVLRNGRRVTIPSHLLVPGDIVFLEAGYFIPADVRLVEAINLRVEEAALTGESVPVQKNASLVMDKKASLGDRKNTAFMGTTVSYGRGRGVVVDTGMGTQLGMIATMLKSVEDEQTPLQRRLDQLGKTLGWAAIIVCALVLGIGVLRGGDLLEMFMVAVSLAIAAVPEGLPAIVTISLALGMREMINRHALIRRLSSVETLGSATIICSDKTGTLTQNEMTVTRLWSDGQFVEVSGRGYRPEGEFLVNNKPVDIYLYQGIMSTLWVGAMNNDSYLEEMEVEGQEKQFRIIGDPTEGAMIVAAAKAGEVQKLLNQKYPRAQEIPFDSVRKRMLTIHEIDEPGPDDISPFDDDTERKHYAIAVKGAPDIVLTLCDSYQTMDDKPVPLTAEMKAKIMAANDDMTQDALRVLGAAYRVVNVLPEEINSDELEQNMIFVGLIGMIDPARKEVQPALELARSAGIRTIMITGDYPNTARAIARDINLLQGGHQVITGYDMDEMSDSELREAVKITDVFARVSPEHKMRIVEALRSEGEVVAMTGDGVNDAPAIKLADIGVAMGITGTDVAKDTADMVLTDDNYASIVAAVEQGRIIYSNIRKFVYYLISCNLAEIMIIFLATAFGRYLYPFAAGEVFSPLAPIQLLLLNLVTDGAPALALGTEKGDPDIMQQKPRPPKEPIINRFMLNGVLIQTVAITFITLFAFGVGLKHDRLMAETMAFITLASSELLRAYTARSERYPILKIGIFNNKWMNIAVASSLALLLLILYVPFFNNIFHTVPLGWTEWRLILPLLLIPSIAAELAKMFVTRRAISR